MDDLSKIRRYELKYTIPESTVDGIRDYISSFCILDKNVPAGQNRYVVNNLYFDTYDLRFYHDTKFRKLTRFKARARYYGMTAGSYIWPEIKYKHASIVWKVRRKISTGEWAQQFTPQVFDTLMGDIHPKVNSFEDVIYWFDARSMVHVRYVREPYVSVQDDYGRITFDRHLCYRLTHGSAELSYNENDMLYYDDPVSTQNPESLVLLEIKVESLVPYWVIKMIKKFELQQRPFSKYCYSIDNLMERNGAARCAVFD